VLLVSESSGLSKFGALANESTPVPGSIVNSAPSPPGTIE
jgi:hypothetical protein